MHAAHAAALAAVPLIDVPLPWMLLLAVLLLLAWRHALRPWTWRLLVGCRDGRWTLVDAHAVAHGAQLATGAVVHPWLVVLPLRLASGQTLRLALFHDSLDAADHAALRRALSVAPATGPERASG